MLVSFELKMCNVGSWNGRWTGSEMRYIIIRTLHKEVAEKILGDKESDSFHHRWDDGWACNVYVNKIDAGTKKSLSKHLKNGFCGYEWMVSNIISHQSTKDNGER